MALAAFIFHLNRYLINRLIFMLAYWYNAPRHIKLIFIIVVCAAIYAANQVQPLSPTYTVLSLVLGFGLHFGQYLQTKIPEHSSYKLKLQFLLRIYPLIIVAIIMWLLPLNTIDCNNTSFRLCTGWIFLVSIYQNRAKRFKQ